MTSPALFTSAMETFADPVLLPAKAERLVVLILVIAATHLLRKLREMWCRQSELNQWIHQTRMEGQEKVHNVLTMATTTNDSVLLTASETRQQILDKSLDPKQNIIFLAKRCRKYGTNQEGVNSVTEELYDDAYATAAALETKLEQMDAKDAPPLLGVPLCVKDCVGLEGSLSTGGLACRLNRRDKQDSLIMEALKEAGAIPLCKGNVCQGMGISESVNRIWGRSRNPWNLSRSPGGSSGGDAALVSTGCVPLSVSADGAGSIRIPASCCGVVGFKPSPSRLTFKNSMRPKKDDKYGSSLVVPATMGPMARSVEDCANFMRAVCSPTVRRGDRNVIPLDFNEADYQDTRKLKIGYFMTDGWMDPCPTGKRAMKEAIEALKKQGHMVVPFQPPTDGWHHNRLFVGITAAEGNMRSYREGLEGEMMIPEYAPLVGVAALPNFFRPIAKLFLPKRVGHLLGCGKNGGLTGYEIWDLCADLLKMKQQWSDAFNDTGVDAVIFPSLPIPAIRHGQCGKIMSVAYMFIGNLLGWPCGALPITTVRQDEQHYRFEDLPKIQRDIMSKTVAEEMVGSAGLPMSISIMTPGFEDEKCLRVMKEIEKGVNFQARPTAFQAKSI
ncbi:acid amide hydrolase 1 [Seminavis robusta]|uniref:Acid amide hydrolase 1 n=1 Tax=Seminavis robusta TaxID=568900 RepID=A0A9N8DD67_9STRA|nr:acid amide hydrolase 1 [Seminavis robusta]|eukprot:Sro93_g048360.1 acid amide hydrolase 1 (613) ;mRNA; r:27477-29868